MKLLVLTQAVDADDQALGFFVRWLDEFAKQSGGIEVICLKEGRYELPDTVRVHSLGKERGVSRLRYVLNFYTFIWQLRRNYDAIFVHMNEEYVLLGGLPWRILGKRIMLWRNHQMGSWRTRLAGFLSDRVCYTSPQAFVAPFKNAVRMPMGIDTGVFTPPASLPPQGSILFLGRLDPIKKPETFFEALSVLSERGTNVKADLYGSPSDPRASYASTYAHLAAPLIGRGALFVSAGVAHRDTPRLYQSHAVYVNLTPSGSFDKTIGEAMASGCVVVASNEALRGVIPDELLTGPSAVSVADAIEKACRMNESERRTFGEKARAYVLEKESLPLLVTRLKALF